MSYDEVLKAVYLLLDGIDLANCMLVSKQWRDIARDDYFWKCLCATRWPSLCKRPTPPTETYYKLYQTFYKRRRRRILPPPRLSFNDLEFYVDIWTEEKLVFSEVVRGPVLQVGIKYPPAIFVALRFQMTLPVEPRFTVPPNQDASVSVLARRKDSNKVACIIHKSMFDYIDPAAQRAWAFDYLEFSPIYPFISDTRSWITLLFMDEGIEGAMDVFGIEMDFCDAANSEDEVLWLLDMLDWK